MAQAYTKAFLVDAYAYRFIPLGQEAYADMYVLGEDHFDKVGKDQFRIAASLDAEAIKEYKNYLKGK